jgi:hypothetical protein
LENKGDSGNSSSKTTANNKNNIFDMNLLMTGINSGANSNINVNNTNTNINSNTNAFTNNIIFDNNLFGFDNNNSNKVNSNSNINVSQGQNQGIDFFSNLGTVSNSNSNSKSTNQENLNEIFKNNELVFHCSSVKESNNTNAVIYVSNICYNQLTNIKVTLNIIKYVSHKVNSTGSQTLEPMQSNGIKKVSSNL